MRVPGQAWLEFKAVPQTGGQTLLTQTAFFERKVCSVCFTGMRYIRFTR